MVDIWHQTNALESQIMTELGNPDYESYRRIFEDFQLYPFIQAVLIGAIYPFEKFLNDKGQRIVEYVPTKRDRSEAGFKLSLGMGKVLYQSGGVKEWKAGGSKTCRTVIWQYTKIIIVLGLYSGKDKELYKRLAKGLGVKHRQWLNDELIAAVAVATDTTQEVASLRLHYAFSDDKKGDRRVSATAGRFTRMLYKRLWKAFKSNK
ncbi:MAG: hypothetical protein AAGH78_00665 [Cyanobacteria bacterium P01_H01_bin.58]